MKTKVNDGNCLSIFPETNAEKYFIVDFFKKHNKYDDFALHINNKRITKEEAKYFSPVNKIELIIF